MAPPSSGDRYDVRAIGWVRRPERHSEPGEFLDPWAESVLEILPQWEDGLGGIEGFSHLVVLFYLHRAERRVEAGERRAAEDAAGLPPVGFFSTRTPKRPNPIGIACPRLIGREGNRLLVRGLDAWDGTPILDIKGYFPRDEGRPDATVPNWLSELWARHDAERGG